MSASDSEDATSSANESSVMESESDADYGVVNLGAGAMVPYQDEPIIHEPNVAGDIAYDEEDIDGIPLESLESRFEKRTPVNQWYVLFFLAFVFTHNSMKIEI